jgi:RES domain-containing protein
LRFQGVCYRAHDPRWAFSPLSGEGAERGGGRFNPKGVAALYLSLSAMGAITEQQAGFACRLQPLTLCEYGVDVDTVIDLRTAAGRKAAGVALEGMRCAWKLEPAPASWRIARRLAREAAGILVPSFATGATAEMSNLVLWTWGPDLPHQVTVFDPRGRLPKNQLSW